MTVRFAPEPPKVMLVFGTRVVFEEVAVSVRFSAGVPASPTVKGISPVGVLTPVLWSGMSEIVGATLLTVTAKLAGP